MQRSLEKAAASSEATLSDDTSFDIPRPCYNSTFLKSGGTNYAPTVGAALMWRSLGGFDADEKKRPSPAQMRAAFDALDADGSGTITLENVAELLAASNPGRVSVENAQQLIAYADVDGSGSIDFDEFCRMIRLAGIIVQLKPREP